ncbi:hypothetical protein IWW38_005668 [Coemansia aciculifera]|uniref:Uncharacterized protein n=1 Tax=Coemansia aciculifera TaxID=417176 RepID=A0ACC1LVX0_9FUNG|nr:hypothetical protein IWW38_005668 [Coemansia aciculifera]
MQLARYNSQTLESFSMETDDCIDIADFIQNTDGSCVEYPQLILLKLAAKSEFEEPQRYGLTDAVPFPSLKCLHIDFDFPFNDDTPFRGNAATLEMLKIRLSSKTVSTLRQCRVFTPVSHPNMRYVRLVRHCDNIADIFSSATDYMQFALSVGPRASVRTIDSFMGNGIVSALPLLSSYDCIQNLTLKDTHFSLWDALALVKSLPLLSDLHITSLDIGALPQGVGKDELSDYVRTTYSLMDTLFRCCHITRCVSPVRSYFASLATCVLLLALACPNFDYAVVDNIYCQQLMNALEKKIDEPGFSQDAPRLRRLLFVGCSSC